MLHCDENHSWLAVQHLSAASQYISTSCALLTACLYFDAFKPPSFSLLNICSCCDCEAIGSTPQALCGLLHWCTLFLSSRGSAKSLLIPCGKQCCEPQRLYLQARHEHEQGLLVQATPTAVHGTQCTASDSSACCSAVQQSDVLPIISTFEHLLSQTDTLVQSILPALCLHSKVSKQCM